MSRFEFSTAGSVVFGRGQFARIGELASGLGQSALVVTNADRSGERGLHEGLTERLYDHKMRSETMWIQGEPHVEDVARGLDRARETGADLLISVGGGSAIDLAKAIAGLLTNPGSALDYLEVVGKGQKLAFRACPHIAVPTTAGTGAEVTRNSVLGHSERRVKASMRSPHLLPTIALVDPELHVGVRPEITASSGMDALTQLVEAYTSRSAQPFTDILCRDGILRVTRSLLRAFREGADLEAREDMALAALLSGMALANAGLGAVHGLAAPLGARFDAPHGAVCAALLPSVIAANIDALKRENGNHPILARYAEVGRILSMNPGLDESSAVRAAREEADRLRQDLAIPGLGRWGVHDSDVAAVASQARASSSMKHNPAVLDEGSLCRILHGAL